MSPADPTPLWMTLYVPLGLAAALFVVAGIIWLVQRAL